jgi:hypothetical protein
MFITTVRQLIAATALSVFALSASALPSLDAVKSEVQKGNYAQAQTLMEEVVAAKPSSARAHYIYAEILAHNQRFDEAARQATTARTLDPAIGFTDPAKFKAFEALLEREQREAKAPVASAAPAMVAPAAPAPEPSAHIPGWVWVAGLLALAGLAWSALKRPAAAAAATSASAPVRMTAPVPMAASVCAPSPMAMADASAGGPGTGGGYGPGAVPRPGSGLLGVGLAAAGGVAAGLLAERLMSAGSHDAAAASAAPVGGDALVPGLFDDPVDQPSAASALEEQPIDFGGGDDWGGDFSVGGLDDW